MKYSDLVCDWLREAGYTKCFFVAGGNIMHLLESASRKFQCVPFVHEVSAAIAAEYHNETLSSKDGKAFVLVTAGPGLTNALTGMAGSFLESRDLLVIGGQVKTSDLRLPGMRQLGIQEIDGIELTKSITKERMRIIAPIARHEFLRIVENGRTQRKGPVLIEFCLDVQAVLVNIPANEALAVQSIGQPMTLGINPKNLGWSDQLTQLLAEAKRPILLIGGEICRDLVAQNQDHLASMQIPLMTTWNAADRIPYHQANFFGRPNIWGMRYSNIILQQSDLLIAVGTRLGIQQTGFDNENFLPKGQIVQFFSDYSESKRSVSKRIDFFDLQPDAYFTTLISYLDGLGERYLDWMQFCQYVKDILPLNEDCNTRSEKFTNPYDFYENLSQELQAGDVLIPSSSGAAETVAMQCFQQSKGVKIVTSASLASMGYGLAGAIGAALAGAKRVFLVEGDGGFAQNLQELGTVSAQSLPIKIFIFDNDGYASIRMTQKNYFDGHYLGCDQHTGLGLPNWELLFRAYGIPCIKLPSKLSDISHELRNEKPYAFIVPVDPEQTYFPKISSRIGRNGAMTSNPLHDMTPSLPDEVASKVMRFLSL